MNKTPRVVLLDIETSPITGYTWSTWDANVLKILEPSKIICVSWKELNSEETHVRALCDYKGYKKGKLDDKALIEEIWHVLDEADVVVAHHGKSFDLKKLNTRFIYYGLNAPSKYEVVDTKVSASRYFKFDSNSLDNLGQYLGLGKKESTGGFELWLGCMQGEPDSWDKMKRYNVQDVNLLEKVYLSLRPFISNHPNLALLGDVKSDLTCPSCLSGNVSKRGFSVTKTGRKQRFQCGDCGSWSTGKFERVNKLHASGEAAYTGGLHPSEDSDT